MFKKLMVSVVTALCILGASSLWAKNVATTKNCQNGEVRQGIIAPHTSGDLPCPTGTQTCVKGEWQGPTFFEICENFTKNCGATPHGATENGYLSQFAAPGMDCIPATRTCLNGNWSGPDIFAFCTKE